MSDRLRDMAFNETLSVDSQLKELDQEETAAAHQLNQSIRWLEAAPLRSSRLATAQAADRNFRKLRMKASSLGQAYIDNALSLNRDADASQSLLWKNELLSVCYFTICVSKVMDVIAQFSGPTAKLITDLKTPLTDLGKEATAPLLPDSRAPDLALTSAQTASALMMGGTLLPDGDDLAALQKGTQALIETIKDLCELVETKSDVSKLAADFKLATARGAEKAAKLLDLANRLITLYDNAPKLTPEFVKKRVPAVVKKLPTFEKATLDGIKKWLNVAKYSLEAFISFYQGCRSFGEVLENYAATKGARSLANQQLVGTGGGSFAPDLNFFAQATDRDLTDIIHHANSSSDANEMARAATIEIRKLKVEIDQLSGEQNRHERLWKFRMDRVDQLRAKLRLSDRKLEGYREQLNGAPPSERKVHQGVVELDLAHQIDEARGKIARYLSPVPSRIAPRGRFGPQYGPQ